MTTLVVLVAGVGGLLAGVLVNRAAGRFPWPERLAPATVLAPGRLAVRPPWVEAGTAALCALTALRPGPSAELPAFLLLAVVAVLLAVVDLQHRLLPDRVVLPSLAGVALLLAGAAAVDAAWPQFGRALLGAAVLFAVFLAMALLVPGQLGMGDVKLAALLGLALGWLGWPAVLLGALAAFVVQALVALLLLAARRVTLRSALPFGPAMLLGAAVAIAAVTPAG
ncbi:prepilin peptidase [Trujillonella endophytica]|uniref:Leader peptidase (Prepilin peptidase) / N-methyltransferase n=1 Tax=Trujillonella endophytica TaxID=673521 RepID=A0A1H8VRB4_9ACTN|nr:prepilin peptidase [Trujillella endophytica]SEP17813.1 leader peptidase (prepilin peptidase) / N-methyltransferase [Trujillella endophytica]